MPPEAPSLHVLGLPDLALLMPLTPPLPPDSYKLLKAGLHQCLDFPEKSLVSLVNAMPVKCFGCDPDLFGVWQCLLCLHVELQHGRRLRAGTNTYF